MADRVAGFAYLAAPIDQMQDQSGYARGRMRAIVNGVFDALVERDITVYNPKRAFTCTPDASMDSIEDVNREALERSRVLVAILPKGVPSIGVPIELAHAHRLGIPTMVITDVKSATLTGMKRDSPPFILMDVESLAVDTPVIKALVDVVENLLAWWTVMRTVEVAQAPAAGPALLVRMDDEYEGTDKYLPAKYHADDAGLDLWVAEQKVIPPHSFVDLPCGMRMQLPPGTFGFVVGRSSAVRRRKLIVIPAVIDVGWRGPMFVGVYNATPDVLTVAEGERLGQLLILPNLSEGMRVERVDELGEHARGMSGFGSTGA
jgi:dUTP pyrophosphatase